MADEDVLAVLQEYIGVSDISYQDRFVEDLSFDSISMYELFVSLEDLSGRDLPVDVLEEISTVGDYVRLVKNLLVGR